MDWRFSSEAKRELRRPNSNCKISERPRKAAAHRSTSSVRATKGLELGFAPGDVEGLQHASADDLKVIEVEGFGLGIHFPKLDADLYAPALLQGVLGSKRWMAAQLGAAGGRARSAAKAAASRENGKRGGPPRKSTAGAGR